MADIFITFFYLKFPKKKIHKIQEIDFKDMKIICLTVYRIVTAFEIALCIQYIRHYTFVVAPNPYMRSLTGFWR